MRIVNRAHAPWLAFVLLATAFAIWLYLGNFRPPSLPAALQLPSTLIQKPSDHRSVGGTPVGLIFGAIALAIFVFASLLGVRKKLVLWRIGTVQRWLRAHIWLSLLTIPLVILHSGFRLGGPMTTLLVLLYVVVMVSGIYGLVLQHKMPGIMMERLPAESVYEQIPYIRARLVTAALKMRDSFKAAPPSKTDAGPPMESVDVATAESPSMAAAATISASSEPGATTVAATDADSDATLFDFMDRQILPYLKAKRGDRFRLGNARFSEDTFRFVKLRVTGAYRNRVEEIQAWCDERRMLDLQVKLQHWLHGWLFIHAPISFLLLILTFWHACVTLFYY